MDQGVLAQIKQLEADGATDDPTYEQLLMEHHYLLHVCRIPLEEWPEPVTRAFAHLNLGILYLSEGRKDEAIKQLRQAVEINPKFWRGHFELASALDKAGLLDEAAREYEVAAPEYKGNGEYQYRIGLVYMKLDQPSKAREHFMRCQELSPGSESASKAYDLMKMLP
jgi:tetratricopeptide (TPR) repeat protein